MCMQLGAARRKIYSSHTKEKTVRLKGESKKGINLKTYERGRYPFFIGSCDWFVLFARPWGPFLERPGNFSGPKSNIQIKI